MPEIQTFFRRKLFIATFLLTVFTGLGGSNLQLVVLQGVSTAKAGPCDIYAAGGTPCVAAHSTVRALFSSYSGNLYQVRRDSDGLTTNIGTLTVGGYANAAAQDLFCAGTRCIIMVIYDQSSQHNHLTIEGSGGVGGQDRGADASALKVMAGGLAVYGVWVDPGIGYRDNAATGTATGSQPQGEYMVVGGTHFNASCCFDYGNTEQTNFDTGPGHMDAVYFGSRCWIPLCNGSGPWVMADLEDGLFAGGDGSNLNNISVHFPFVTALTKNNGSTTYAIKVGNANAGNLTTLYDGTLPTQCCYFPMSREGGIVLGTGGDNSNSAVGSFFEGAMTAGYPSDATDNAVQADIVSVDYREVSVPSYSIIVNRNSGKCVDIQQPNTANGANVGQWACNGQPWQNWRLVEVSDGVFQIFSPYSGKCLDVQQPNEDNGANVGQWECTGRPWQLWQRVVTTAPYFSLVSRNSGKVLDVADCGAGDGVNIRQWAWLNNNCQQWSLVINEGSYGRIVNRNSGKCADVQQPNTADGANVGQWACNGEPWQNWKFVDMGGGYFQIFSPYSGKCLDVQQPNADNGANVGQWACNGQPWQMWQRVITTTPYFSLVSRNSGKVLEVADCGAGDGVNIRQWAWLNNNCQQWSLVIDEGSYGRIVNRNSGKCADVQQPNTADGANVGQWACNGEPWQNWKFVDMGGGNFQIVSQNSGKCLDTQQPNADNGANVGQWACNGEPWQMWQAVVTTAPYFSFVSRNSGKVLDVADCGAGDGVNIRQWAWLNNNCQQWSIQ